MLTKNKLKHDLLSIFPHGYIVIYSRNNGKLRSLIYYNKN